MTKLHKTPLQAIVFLCLALVLLLASCASASAPAKEPPKEPDVDPYPQATREVLYIDRGEQFFRSGISETGDFLIPVNDPVREGCTFNGWWVYCDEGVIDLSKYMKLHPEAEQVTAQARWVNTSFTMEQYGTMGNTQDGAIYGNYILRFNASGSGMIHDMSTRRYVNSVALDSAMYSKFQPHSNCTVFGCTYYEEGDEFPLFYANAYNNYDVKIDRRLGTVGVYRITRDDRRFTAKLVQVIRIGFTSDKTLWMSGIGADKSPYGNMVVDTDNGKLWFFVPRDTNKTTRFFCFDIPAVTDGTYSEEFGVNLVTLQADDIVDMFDATYCNYLQGGCYHDGKIYSLEGMGTGVSPNVLRIFDLGTKTEDCVVDFFATGYWKEPEFIDFWEGDIYFSDFSQIVYKLTGV